MGIRYTQRLQTGIAYYTIDKGIALTFMFGFSYEKEPVEDYVLPHKRLTIWFGPIWIEFHLYGTAVKSRVKSFLRIRVEE